MKYGKLTLGQIEAALNMIGGEDGVKRILGGFADVSIVMKAGVIDCDAPPKIPTVGDRVISHLKWGLVRWDPSLIKLHVTEKQKSSRKPDGMTLQKSLVGLRHMNANVLDYLLDNPDQIPEWLEVKADRHGVGNRYTVFWGTVYDGDDGEYVRALTKSMGTGQWIDIRLQLDWREDPSWKWDEYVPAALHA